MADALTSGMVGIIHYTLTDDDGATVDSSRGGEPFAYLHGHSNIVPGLERALEGKAAGDSLQVSVAPADGYGERQGPGPERVHRNNFPKDFPLVEGRAFRAQGSDGEPLVLWITKVEGSGVWVDINHPLAGKNLNFDVEIIGIRPATADEIQHGHAHGVHGHPHHH